MGQSEYILLASLLGGSSVAAAIWLFIYTITCPRESDEHGYFESQRREQLRQSSTFYRLFEPLVDDWAKLLTIAGVSSSKQVALRLSQARSFPPWHANEYQSVSQFCGFLPAVIFGILTYPIAGMVGLVVLVCAGMAGAGYIGNMHVAGKAEEKLRAIRSRFPFAIDLVALMMEAGATFDDGVRTFASENAEHALGVEFRDILGEIECGRSRSDAVKNFGHRIHDADIQETIFAIVKGWELGTPVGEVFRTQAKQMRLKRSQWAEKAAGEAQVKIVFPGMVIMLACLVICLAPIVMLAVKRAYS